MTDSVPVPGRTFGHYTIESLLGTGGMGSVYRAKDERLDRQVAIKVLAPALAADSEFRERFLRESRLAASLDHPNIIPIYDAGEVDGALYLAMRYVHGPSLHELLQARGSLTGDDTIRLAQQIGGALDAAHREALVHRDVKPANILLAESGNHAYLCDFGLAKRTSTRGATKTGFFLGTVDYCAPEQIDGRQVDGRADLYSLGCVTFHCLTGSPPYARSGEFAVLQAHLSEPPPAPTAVRPDLPPAVDAVLQKALAKEPGERFGTASELTDALRDALGGAAAGSTRAASLVAERAPEPAPTRPEQGRRNRRTSRRTLVAMIAVATIVLVGAGIVLAFRGTGRASKSASERTFVDRVENVLVQSAAGRREIRRALQDGLACSIPAADAARRIGSVADNRQSILEQLGSLPTSTDRDAHIVTLLQAALQNSIEADRHYRDGFRAIGAGASCPIVRGPEFALAAASDLRATDAKARFLTQFNALARDLGRRVWLADQI